MADLKDNPAYIDLVKTYAQITDGIQKAQLNKGAYITTSFATHKQDLEYLIEVSLLQDNVLVTLIKFQGEKTLATKKFLYATNLKEFKTVDDLISETDLETAQDYFMQLLLAHDLVGETKFFDTRVLEDNLNKLFNKPELVSILALREDLLNVVQAKDFLAKANEKAYRQKLKDVIQNRGIRLNLYQLNVLKSAGYRYSDDFLIVFHAVLSLYRILTDKGLLANTKDGPSII